MKCGPYCLCECIICGKGPAPHIGVGPSPYIGVGGCIPIGPPIGGYPDGGGGLDRGATFTTGIGPVNRTVVSVTTIEGDRASPPLGVRGG
jgi:hypothetical protein